MRIITHIQELRDALQPLRQQNIPIGFVPTMGALHEGHISLIDAARLKTTCVVASVFVNPAQFGPGEDFERYPRQAEKDAEMLEKAGTNFLFMPSREEMYPVPPRFTLTPGESADVLCGKSRPGHFAGVGIIVSKLLNIVQPQYAFFGQKDLQQCLIIRQMVEDFNMPVKIEICPIIRDADGLAKSSRNQYLSPEERKSGLALSAALAWVQKHAQAGAITSTLTDFARKTLNETAGIRLDYFEIVESETLKTPDILIPENNPVAAVAAWVGKTRLIDNEFLFS